MDTLVRLDPNKEFFVKILYDKDECSALNRNNFHTASIVATATAKWEGSSFENFYMDNAPSSVRLQELVNLALERRQQLLPINVGELEEWKRGKKEIKAYYTIMKGHLERVLKPPSSTLQLPNLPFQLQLQLPNESAT